MSDTPDEFRRRLETPEYAMIPAPTRAALNRYYAHRLRTGSATQAFLEKNFDVIVMVDEKVLVGLPAMLRLFHCNAADACWGSPEKVADWISGKTPRPKRWPADDVVSRLGATS